MTFLLETVRLGLSNLRLRVLRSALTALGIILGVAAVITMVSIGEGSKRAALDEIERLGARNIIIRSIKPAEALQQQGGNRRAWLAKYGITRDDLDVIRARFADAQHIVPLKAVGSEVLQGSSRKVSQAFGTTPDLQNVAGIRVARGRYLKTDDLEERSAVAVIGSEVARNLFPFEDPLGATLRIDKQVFKVVGVLAPVGLGGGAGAKLIGRDLNHDVHIPLTTAYARFGNMVVRRGGGQFSAEEVPVSEIYIESPTKERVLSDAAILKRALQVRHPKMDDVQMVIPYELLETAARQAMTWNLVLGAIAGISLLVGGIGIMNIMLATVTERTREIGIRRALGATRRHITWQFLVETGVLSAVGGVLGVALGVGISIAIELVVPKLGEIALFSSFISPGFAFPTIITGWSIALSFSVALFTGLVFGIYPAMVAAKQDPIVALRHD